MDCPYEVGDIIEVKGTVQKDPSPPGIGETGRIFDIDDITSISGGTPTVQLWVKWNSPRRTLAILYPYDAEAIRKVEDPDALCLGHNGTPCGHLGYRHADDHEAEAPCEVKGCRCVSLHLDMGDCPDECYSHTEGLKV